VTDPRTTPTTRLAAGSFVAESMRKKNGAKSSGLEAPLRRP
jgi:hypothetical protein